MGWLALSFMAARLAAEPIEPERVATVIEALTRLGPEKVEANPKLKEALGKVLQATKGTPQFVELVRDFKIQDQDPALLDFAARNPNSSSGAEAIRLILAKRNFALISGLLASMATRNATWFCANRPFARWRRSRRAPGHCSDLPGNKSCRTT